MRALFLTVLVVLMLLAAGPSYSAGISGDIFGQKDGIVHPFLEITEKYTDNLTNSYSNKESEFITTISPGMALALPGTGSTDVAINTSTAAPGGLAASRRAMDTSRRFQGIVVYNAELERYKEYSEEDFTGHKVTGAFHYKAPGGLIIDIADKYQYAQEAWGETVDNPDHETYADNVAHAIVDFAFSSKLSLFASGAYHTVEYKNRDSEFRDRDDLVYGGSFNFHLRPKTRLFCEYKRIEVKYDSALSAGRDNTEENVYAGITWDITARSQGTIKVGYSIKNFAGPVADDQSDWTGEIDISHMLTDRTMVGVSAVRGFYETNLATADYYLTNRLNLTYNQALTKKFSGNLVLSYQNDEYGGMEIENDTYRAQPGITFSPYRWLTCRLAYSYSKRQSDQASWEYATNEYTFSLKAAF